MSEFRVVEEPAVVKARKDRTDKANAFVAFCKAHPNEWCEFGTYVHGPELAVVTLVGGMEGLEIEAIGYFTDMDHRAIYDSVVGRWKA